MRKKYILKLFMAFLKKNGAYEIFLQTLKDYTEQQNKYIYQISEPIQYITSTITSDPRFLIISAFDWSKAEYKKVNWGKLNSEWSELIEKITKQN